MSEKLFMIRVDMERFLGPMTLKEVRDSYRRMEFGLQDEIAGSNRAWVAFDDLERVKRHYPELVNMIKKEMLSGWGTSSHSAIPITHDMKKQASPKKRFGLFSKILLLSSISIVSFGGVFLLQDDRWKDIKLMLSEPLLSQAALLYADGYNKKFEAFMIEKQDDIIESYNEPGLRTKWLPYVRSILFARPEAWKSVDMIEVRGVDVIGTPMDCSVKAWQRRWRQSKPSWNSFFAGTLLPQDDWARILLWDVDWIQQRPGFQKGWMQPTSFYDACLKSAFIALRGDSKIKTSEKAAILARMKWLRNLLLGVDSDEEFQMAGALWTLSCIETSEPGDGLEGCLRSTNPEQEWSRYLQHRLSLQQSRALIFENSVLDAARMQQLKLLRARIFDEDPVTGFDYKLEKELYSRIIDYQGNIKQAVRNLNSQNKDVQFSH